MKKISHASAWDTNSQHFLRQFDCKYNKIASAMIVNHDLLKLVAEEKKHTFISTGMSELKDIDYAVNLFKKYNCPYELMHTVSTYPMRDTDANLNVIRTLRNRYNCNIGYSGHESGLAISFAAAKDIDYAVNLFKKYNCLCTWHNFFRETYYFR